MQDNDRPSFRRQLAEGVLEFVALGDSTGDVRFVVGR